MRSDSPYRYRIVVQGKQLGPFDRRTIVGMRIKKLLDNNLPVQRSDGHHMTVAQLMMDRFEMADAQGVNHPACAPASGLWPTFAADFGGGWRGAGALGFSGKGELRFQGDVLRLSGQRRGRVFGSTPERIKLPTAGIASAMAAVRNTHHLELWLKPSQPFDEARKGLPVVLALDDADSVKELLELMNLGD